MKSVSQSLFVSTEHCYISLLTGSLGDISDNLFEEHNPYRCTVLLQIFLSRLSWTSWYSWSFHQLYASRSPLTAQQSSLEPNPQAGRLSWRVRPADEEEVARILNLKFYIVDFNLNLFSFSFGEYYSLSTSWEDLLRSSLPGFLSGACCTSLNWLLNYYYYYY